jgi:hypothetical protein
MERDATTMSLIRSQLDSYRAEIEHLVERIHEAFPTEEVPVIPEITDELARRTYRIRGMLWSSLDIKDVSTVHWWFLDPVSYAYYLPAALTILLSESRCAFDLEHFCLRPLSVDRKMDDLFAGRFIHFNDVQLRLVAEFIKVMADRGEADAQFAWTLVWKGIYEDQD